MRRPSKLELLAPSIILISILMLLELILGLGDVDDAFKRFANAILTSFTVASGILFGAMIFYADSRNRPLAPIFAMLFSTSVGAIITLVLLNQGNLLLENNGDMWAQFLSNLVQLLVAFSALLISCIFVGGLTFAFITGRAPKTIFDEEE